MTARLPEAAGYVLDCADAELAAALRSWLDDSHLDWPGIFHLRATIVDSVADADDPREAFPQPGIRIQAGPPSGTVRIRWTDHPAEAVVHSADAAAELWFTPDAVRHLEGAERGFLLVVLLFVLRRLGWYHVHGAALTDPASRGWMFVGNSKTGKSTTTALLAAHGWAVGTDDIAFLRDEGSRVGVRGFRSPIALREGGRQLLGTGAGLDFARRQKTGYWPEDLGGRWAGVVVPEIILFPEIGEHTTIAPLAPREVLSLLVRWSMWVLFEEVHAQEHLDLLGRLAGQCVSYQATFGPDLLQNPSLLSELLP
jgi:hypothetical protein